MINKPPWLKSVGMNFFFIDIYQDHITRGGIFLKRIEKMNPKEDLNCLLLRLKASQNNNKLECPKM